jgi:hypothetical protein
MKKPFALMIAVSITVVLGSCVTVQAVKSGGTLSAGSGYMAIVFANKAELISIGSRKVYVEIQQLGTGASFFVPFGSGGELRLISAAPGDFRINGFFYASGYTSRQDADIQNPGVIYGPPVRAGVTLENARFPEGYLRTFTVRAGEIVCLGNYSWEGEILTLSGPAVTITRSVQPADSVLDAVLDAHPAMPASIRVVPLED